MLLRLCIATAGMKTNIAMPTMTATTYHITEFILRLPVKQNTMPCTTVQGSAVFGSHSYGDLRNKERHTHLLFSSLYICIGLLAAARAVSLPGIFLEDQTGEYVQLNWLYITDYCIAKDGQLYMQLLLYVSYTTVIRIAILN